MLWFGQKSFINEQKLLQAENAKRGDAILEESHLNIDIFLREIKSEISTQLLKINWTNNSNFHENLLGQPLIKQVFITDNKGKLLFPLKDDESNPDGIEFVKRTKNVWLNKSFKTEVINKLSGINSVKNKLSNSMFYANQKGSRGNISKRLVDGFLTWYWEEGLNLLYWCENPKGYIVGAEINFAYLKARLIGRLPNRLIHPGTIKLIDSRSAVIYQWGDYEINEKANPLAKLRVQYPLDSWTLQYYTRSQESLGRLKKVYDLALNTNLLFLGLFILFVGGWIGFYLWRDIKIIENRMSFVTQVSHELRTPLTNIRLYSELLGRIESSNEKHKKYISVIVQESERLSRLIQNVLTFNKDKNKTKENLSIVSLDINDLIENIILQEEPYLIQLGFKVELNLTTESNAFADKDSIIQIIGNVISNAEKYAKEGKYIGISSSEEKGFILIDIVDYGPGIPSSLLTKVFSPFFRIHNNLSDGVAGTGIGLTISKELAILNGGDLICMNVPKGSRFRLKLKKYKEV